VCPGVFLLSACSDSASVPDNRVSTSASPLSRRKPLKYNSQGVIRAGEHCHAHFVDEMILVSDQGSCDGTLTPCRGR
jgi:hypothetical protein